ncbi:uncharacterized protein LOC113464071 [Ceratina calcarata]|uniref:Uncharacterized protein LOC113464071 n=1 Tax=Ceratina calcarata TaxID=156304 RepID=A0AAJ7RYL9_9HYME|nr:uncharacterized protein LOC113464071 [Ceratina calcarata]
MDREYRFNFELTTIAAYRRRRRCGPVKNANKGEGGHWDAASYLLSFVDFDPSRRSTLDRVRFCCAMHSSAWSNVEQRREAILELDTDSTSPLVHCQSSVLGGSDTRDHVTSLGYAPVIRNIEQRLPRGISRRSRFELNKHSIISCNENSGT